MKKFLALLLALTMVLSLAACGAKAPEALKLLLLRLPKQLKLPLLRLPPVLSMSTLTIPA